ncbi:zinc/iron-chelating domain-containing protein [Pseudomonas sp. Choline-3u-10]|nr:zinc/iron-chelating domain-containing protein [Pseudomonas sp. Choline-3u-10]
MPARELCGLYYGGHGLPVAPFPCSKCGLCCQKVNLAQQTRFLDRGDGTCRHYDTIQKICRVYDQRPDICRVDRQYAQHYASTYTWEQFVVANAEACRALQVADQEIPYSSDRRLGVNSIEL